MTIDHDLRNKTIAELRAELAEVRDLKEELAIILGAAVPGTGARRTLLQLLLARHPQKGGESLRQNSRRTRLLAGKLSATKIGELVKHAKAGKLEKRWFGDGGNLWLQISNNGTGVSWIFRWTDRGTGQDRNMGLGSYATVDLQMARERARQCRLMLSEDKDPKAERDEAKLSQQIQRGLAKTVSQVLDEYFEAKIARKSRRYREQVTSWFKSYVHNTVGNIPIQKVNSNHILDDCRLRQLWTQKHEVARRLQIHLEASFRLAIARNYYRGENPAKWKNGLEHALPSHKDVHKVKHHASLPYHRVGWLMQKIRTYKYTRHGWCNVGRPVPLAALEFIVLTGVRTGEVLAATWGEFDIPNRVWTVPKEHTKAKRADRGLPITKSMLAVLEEMGKRRLSQSPDAMVFPSITSRKRGGPLDESGVWHFIRYSLKADVHFTAHGFRSTLKDWVRGETTFPEVWWDIQVDHSLGDQVGQAYGHDKLLKQRRGMMELWDEYCSKPAPDLQPTASEVIKLVDKRRSA